MDILKEATARTRACPIRQPAGQCLGAGCMGWAEAPPTTKTVTIAWPESIKRPQPPQSTVMATLLETPEELAAKFKRAADEALASMAGDHLEGHEDMTITRSVATDYRLTKASVTLVGPAIGSCSLIR